MDAFVERPHVVGPDAGRVDHGRAAHVDLLAVGEHAGAGDRPAASLSTPISDTPLATTAPKSMAAVRAMVSVSRASSAWAS